KEQVEFSFFEKIEFKKGDKTMVVLLPLFSKFNKRKLAKLAKLLDNDSPKGRDKFHILANLAVIDKFVKMDELLDFFSIDREKMIAFLLEMELRKKLKVISINNLSVTSYENYQDYRTQLNDIFTACYTGRNQVLKFSEIETKLKLPQASIFFRYLIHTFTNDFSFQIKKDKLLFKKVSLSENEKASLGEIAELLKKQKLTVFTIEDINKLSDLSNKEINDTLWLLIESGEVAQLTERYFIFSAELNKIINKLKKYKRNQGEMIDIQALRELTSFTRKYIIALFEYFDAQQITTRVESQRKILLAA
ncbi:MAG TPA: SelB C-terminal domain-containing protein, partial [Candidatus Kapabacteria bacterium]|nr:SelB C-terminal domain-containing protein [Candidatus Kapabacteria bacterium]